MDARLRPSGAAGMLVTSAAFADYQKNEAGRGNIRRWCVRVVRRSAAHRAL
nr:hypothetical protein [Escherichia coli]